MSKNPSLHCSSLDEHIARIGEIISRDILGPEVTKHLKSYDWGYVRELNQGVTKVVLG